MVMIAELQLQTNIQSISVFLTQFGDAYFLQILPGDVGDEFDVLITILY